MAAATGPIRQAIVRKLTETFRPIHLDVINESHMHNVPKDSETHFKVLLFPNIFSKYETHHFLPHTFIYLNLQLRHKRAPMCIFQK